MIKKITDLYKIKIEPILLNSKWRNLLGNIPKNEQWVMMIFGYSQSGKSSFALKVCDVLGKTGNILYNAAEEKLNTGTITERIRRMNVTTKNLDIFQNRKLDQLKSFLHENKYKFCVIDSCNRMSMNTPELLEIFALPELFPDTSFIFIVHGNKEQKNYIGPAMLQNKVDIAIELKSGDVKIVKNYYSTKEESKPINIFKDKF